MAVMPREKCGHLSKLREEADGLAVKKVLSGPSSSPTGGGRHENILKLPVPEFKKTLAGMAWPGSS